MIKFLLKTVVFVFITTLSGYAQPQFHQVKDLKVTILSTMLADQGIGEWGFCALIEVDGKKILFDTGARPETVLSNVREMKIDLSDVTDVFISHHHGDHTGGLMTLRNEFSKKNPKALSVAHIGEGAFYPRPNNKNSISPMLKNKEEYEKSGGKFIIYNSPKEIYPGVWTTGPVPRKEKEQNWSGSGKLVLPTGETVEDNIPEDQSMVFYDANGLVVVSGCGHAGIVNTLTYTQSFLNPVRTKTLIGGFHLFDLDDDRMNWTCDKLKTFGIENFIGAHCTGINAVYFIQRKLGLGRNQAIVGSVGSGFELGKGINAGQIAK
ncbi:MAG: MBL fold metallo-hydrolase [Cyclobacteriaceae bacterium]|nr:MBL fold metallo-hydrolase [Cyclobacteriaceae bacterium]